MTLEELRERLRLPIVVAPMFLVSGPDLVIAAAKAGLIGALPSINARCADEFGSWLERIVHETGHGLYAVNLIVRAALDPENLPERVGVFKPAIAAHIKPWRDVWSSGHGVGLIDDVPSVAELVDRLEAEYRGARDALHQH